MFFMQTYIKVAREKHPDIYTQMNYEPSFRQAMQTLWSGAEGALRESCSNPLLGINDNRTLRKIYSSEGRKEMTQFFQAGGAPFVSQPVSDCSTS